MKKSLSLALCLAVALSVRAQSELYPQHFDLEEVTLLESPLQDAIAYDEAANTLTVSATGANNVCLMLDYENAGYNVSSDLEYLLVQGEGLSLTSAGVTCGG